ncbi:MAG TPA: sigma 54-interacting transcriptional regulator [Kofleriaceae bacterium]|nr:sigma 54-interacting transcriptional regulator [Kofleriaceae bacterium]
MVDLKQFSQLPGFRAMQDLIRRWWGLELAIADDRGYVLDHAEGKIIPSDNEFCRQALFSKEGFRRCNDSVKLVRDRLRGVKKKSVVVHQCHLGFDIVAAPIHDGDRLVGFVFTGGSLHEEPSATARHDLLRKVRELTSADRADARAMEEALPAIPRTSAVELEHLSDMVELAAQEVNDALRERGRRPAGSRAATAPAAGNKEPGRFRELVGQASAMQEVFQLLEKIVRSESTVLIHGESGTGKELIARAIHYNGPRAKKPFVVQNCSAFNDNLLESALFGHVRGAFTGAVKDQKGLFEVADGGTFFLDEVGDMSPALQVKLLRVLQEGTLTPVGATRPVKVDVRIIAASHKDLGKMVERGEFREDLYYRINVLKVVVPPLRDRIADLPLLVEHFLHKHHHGSGAPPRLSDDAMAALAAYRWPGNIRELENEIERLIVLGADEEELPASLLSPRIREAAPEPQGGQARPPTWRLERMGTLREVVESVEAEVIAQGLIRTHWNKSQLAKELGISRSNLIQKCSYYGLDRKE